LFLAGDTFVVVDQHAAHERITFERLRAAAAAGRVASQRLLVPLSLELEGRLLTIFEARAEALSTLGFQAEIFGERSLRLDAVPALLADASPGTLLRDVLAEFSELAQGSIWEEARQRVLARMACHASVRAGRTLGADEALALIEAMRRADNSGRCPHGRPAVVEIPRAEVETWFRRG
jgi:DNA mismatch repair protein MutL